MKVKNFSQDKTLSRNRESGFNLYFSGANKQLANRKNFSVKRDSNQIKKLNINFKRIDSSKRIGSSQNKWIQKAQQHMTYNLQNFDLEKEGVEIEQNFPLERSHLYQTPQKSTMEENQLKKLCQLIEDNKDDRDLLQHLINEIQVYQNNKRLKILETPLKSFNKENASTNFKSPSKRQNWSRLDQFSQESFIKSAVVQELVIKSDSDLKELKFQFLGDGELIKEEDIKKEENGTILFKILNQKQLQAVFCQGKQNCQIEFNDHIYNMIQEGDIMFALLQDENQSQIKKLIFSEKQTPIQTMPSNVYTENSDFTVSPQKQMSESQILLLEQLDQMKQKQNRIDVFRMNKKSDLPKQSLKKFILSNKKIESKKDSNKKYKIRNYSVKNQSMKFLEKNKDNNKILHSMLEKYSNHNIPCLPKIKQLSFYLFNSWGNEDIGLRGIEIFDQRGKSLQEQEHKIELFKGNRSVLMEEDESVKKFFYGDHQGWILKGDGVPYSFKLEFPKPVQISLMRIWNHNTKGVQSMVITGDDDEKFLFAGEIVKQSQRKFESILFSSNRNVLKLLHKNDPLRVKKIEKNEEFEVCEQIRIEFQENWSQSRQFGFRNIQVFDMQQQIVSKSRYMIKSNVQDIEELGLYNEREQVYEMTEENFYVEINFLFKTKVSCIKLTNLTNEKFQKHAIKLFKVQVNKKEEKQFVMRQNNLISSKFTVDFPLFQNEKLNLKTLSGFLIQIKIHSFFQENPQKLYGFEDILINNKKQNCEIFAFDGKKYISQNKGVKTYLDKNVMFMSNVYINFFTPLNIKTITLINGQENQRVKNFEVYIDDCVVYQGCNQGEKLIIDLNQVVFESKESDQCVFLNKDDQFIQQCLIKNLKKNMSILVILQKIEC